MEELSQTNTKRSNEDNMPSMLSKEPWARLTLVCTPLETLGKADPCVRTSGHVVMGLLKTGGEETG